MLQDRHDQFSEILQAVRQQGIDDEAVGCALLEPGLNGVGHLFGGADKIAPWPGEAQGDFAQGQAFVAGQLFDPLRAAFLAVGTQVAQVGKRGVQRVLAEIMVIEGAAEGDDCVFDAHQ